MLARLAVPRFVERASDLRLHDGVVKTVKQVADKLYVGIEPGEGSPATVVFHGVTAVRNCQPEGLAFSSLVEWTDSPPLRGFEFVNWFQPGDDWDPVRAEACLEVVALGYHVVRGWTEPEPALRPVEIRQR